MRELLQSYVILSCFIISMVPAQNPSQLFQQALLKENGEGNLKAAIKIYEQIVADDNSGRELRAKALLHMGRCWEKMGKAEARNAYERLVNEFKDQQDVAGEAQIRLIALEKQNEPKVSQR